MRELQVDVVCFINENNKRELHFNYYDSEGRAVAYIHLDEEGHIEWQIFNLMYKDYLDNIIGYIYIGNTRNYVSHKDSDSNLMRWTRARMFIENHNLNIKYVHELDDYMEEEKSIMR